MPGSLAAVFNYDLPFILFLPYVPFELVTGLWILVKGVPGRSVDRLATSR